MIAGTPFDINSLIKDSVFVPGTRGFISLIQGPDYKNPNIVFLKSVVVRRGVGGKDRINSNVLLCPIFKSDTIKDKSIMFPKESDEVEYKYLVDLDEAPTKMLGDVTDKEYIGHIDFMGWLLSKALLLKALDSVVYEAINESLGIHNGRQNNIWKPRNESLLSEFTHIVETQVVGDDLKSLFESFCTKGQRTSLVSELYSVEAKLSVPKIEYNKRAATVIAGAYKHIRSKTKDAKNKVDIMDGIVPPSQKHLDKSLKTRLGLISKNRKILKM